MRNTNQVRTMKKLLLPLSSRSHLHFGVGATLPGMTRDRNSPVAVANKLFEAMRAKTPKLSARSFCPKVSRRH